LPPITTRSPKFVMETFAPAEVNLVTSAGRYPSAFVQVVGELL
jgi:hypothetical protein